MAADRTRLSIPTADFATLRENKQIYVDKTALLAPLAQINGAYFLSRPRRFGKSLLLSTFADLFQNGLSNFSHLHIEQTWKESKDYFVLKLNFASYQRNSIEIFTQNFCYDLISRFHAQCQGLRPYSMPIFFPNLVLSHYLSQLPSYKLVLLIDEYDSPITHTFQDKNLQKSIIDILASFFTVLKEFSHKCRFVFITGITRIAHVSLFSDVNFIKGITFDDQYSNLLGITQDEIYTYYDDYVAEAADILDTTKEDVYAKLKEQYDGYKFSTKAKETVYNPWSLINFFQSEDKKFKNYWYESAGTPTLLINYIDKNSADENNTDSIPFFIKQNFIGRKNFIEEIPYLELERKSSIGEIPCIPLLVQTGYLTIKDHDPVNVTLKIPNDEVYFSLILLSLQSSKIKISRETSYSLNSIEKLIDSENIEGLVKVFNQILTEVSTPNSIFFENENSVRDIIYSMIPEDSIFKTRENPNAFGYSDLELRTKKTRLCIEFKRSYKGKTENKALAQGIEQIRKRDYACSNQPTLRYAMAISTKKRAITCFEKFLID
ncbi:MAG: AAA family ATPase [Desulfovibrio sp.]|nr:AAA family ATPase [Desulfovibrio sp.]